MPPTLVYAVDFKQGNLSPSPDANAWGPMRLGSSGPGGGPASAAHAKGLLLSATPVSEFVAIGPFVVLEEGDLAVAGRFVMRVEFERPTAEPPVPPASGAPEPWAVVSVVKYDDEIPERSGFAGVSCQFRAPGVRLNTPGAREGDQAVHLTDLDYEAPTPYTLEHYFCGLTIAQGYTTGFGSLTLGRPVEADQRSYSSVALVRSPDQPEWIGALGVALASVTGSGHIEVRLRSFSVSTW